ncbi:MAG TPA: extracellular solute-binding protein [Chloroflexota bacterium]|nr:extracellular solute-binding protein [Chloroflexota bacterium]
MRPATPRSPEGGRRWSRRAVVPGGLAVLGAPAVLAACAAPGAPAPPAGEGQGQALSGEVTVMHAGSQPSGEAEARWTRFKGVFQDRHPRLSLNLVWDPRLYADRKLEVLMAADSVPAVASLRRQAEIPRLAYLQGALPLDPYVNKSVVVKKADYYDKVLAGHTLDGKLYVVPHDMTLFSLFYNADAFAQQGLKPPDLTWDYEDWQQAALRLTRTAGGGSSGPRTQFGVEMPSWWVIHYLGNRGLPLMDGGVGLKPPAQWSVTYDRPETIAGYKWQADQWCRYACAAPQPDAGDPSTATEEQMTFERGKAAMRFVDSSAAVGFQERIKEFRWNVTLPPLGDKRQPRVTTSIGRGYGLMKGARGLDGGWAFIEVYNDPKRFLEDVREAGGGPYGSRAVMESKEYQSSPVPPADKSIWVEGLKTARFFPEPGWELSLVVDTSAVTANTGDIWLCKESAEAVLRPYGQQINRLLKEKTGS